LEEGYLVIKDMSSQSHKDTRSQVKRKKIGIVGYGNMGSAIAENIKSAYEVFVFDKDSSKLQQAQGISFSKDIRDLINSVDIVVLAVKPQDFDPVLKEIKGLTEGKIFVTIAAGVTANYIEKQLGKIKVVRAMPNLGVITGKSMTCICKGKFAGKEDFDLAKELFMHVGKVREVDESKMNAVTAVSGSGPGYYFNEIVKRPDDYARDKNKFIKEFETSLAEAAREIGLDEEMSLLLARETVILSDVTFEIVKKIDNSGAEQLRDKVTSKGGTTEAGLKVINSGGSLADAVKAALKRAEELSK